MKRRRMQPRDSPGVPWLGVGDEVGGGERHKMSKSNPEACREGSPVAPLPHGTLGLMQASSPTATCPPGGGRTAGVCGGPQKAIYST